MKPESVGSRTTLVDSYLHPAQNILSSSAQRLALANFNEGGHNLSTLPLEFFKNRQSADLLTEFATVLGDGKPVYVGLWSPSSSDTNVGATEKIINTLHDKSSTVLWVLQKGGTLIMGCKPNAGDLPLKHSILATLNQQLVGKLDLLTQTGGFYKDLLDDQKLFTKLAGGSPDLVVSAGTMWIKNNSDLKTPELFITNESGHFEPSAVSTKLIESFQKDLIQTLHSNSTQNPLKVVYKTYTPGDEA